MHVGNLFAKISSDDRFKKVKRSQHKKLYLHLRTPILACPILMMSFITQQGANILKHEIGCTKSPTKPLPFLVAIALNYSIKARIGASRIYMFLVDQGMVPIFMSIFYY